jgi:hypothetical protein
MARLRFGNLGMGSTIAMSTSFIPDWTAEQRKAFRKEPVFGRHALLEREDTRALFTDEALADLLDNHPVEDLDMATMADVDHDPDSWAEVARAGRSGAEIVQAVKRGRIWVNVRNVHKHHRKMGEIVTGFFDDLQTHNPGFSPRKLYGGLLISSPGTRVFYHADQGEMSLWQVRGTKRFYLYPNREPFLDLGAYEGAVLKEQKEEIDWRPEFDEHALVKVMEPGDFATWPLAAPHKVINEDALNVSFTTEFTTFETRVTLGAVYANGFMRRHMGLKLPAQQITASYAERLAKCALSVPIQLLKLNNPYRERYFELYELDPHAPDGLQKLPEPRLRTT